VVKETIARMAVKDPKLVGKIMGEIMKAHKGKFEPPTVKRIVEEELK
jgi:Asp-tRNA(Asn)/Glu-tRNA(Gln) amidotransferase B subunit